MRALWMVACLASGCATDAVVDAVEQSIGAEPGDDGTGGGCPVWGCGSNTSKVHGIPFVEMHELGDINGEGFSLVRFEQMVGADWYAFRPDVHHAALVARDLTSTAIVLEHAQLVGARFEIQHARTGLAYYLTIVAIGEMYLWAQPVPTDKRLTRTYRLQWQLKPGQGIQPLQPQDICGANPDGASGGGPMADFHAVLFEDDRFDVEELRVVGETPDWFNIGCAGHALAKQHLLAHTKAAGAILHTATTIAQRTANLKMITADYCGNGRPFTVPGQPLKWRDEHGWYDTVTTAGVVEARWAETGAVCLSTPRVDFTPTLLGSITFPTGVNALLPRHTTQWCATRPPPCTGATTDMQRAHLITVNQ